MIPKTVLVCFFVILFFIILEYLRYLPNVTKMYLKSEFRGRQLVNRKLFADYLKRFNKSYGVEEHHKRFRHFKKNLKKADRLNDGINHAWFGVTKFSDWSERELSQMLTPAHVGDCEPLVKNCSKSKLATDRRDYRQAKYEYLRYGRVLGDGEVPLRWDWREHNIVTPVFDQKRCQICWAASITGVMESMAAIHGLGLTTLSKQQLMDCIYDSGDPKLGCIKGRPLVNVFLSMCSIEHTHLATEAEYPLTFADEDCKNIRGVRALKRYENRCSMNEEELVRVLANNGPVTALVDSRLFYNYISGIISHNCQIPQWKLNHAVQIVGYDKTTQPPHYIVRNSWGEDWGERGYARLAIGGNQCGIAYSVGILDVY